MINIRIYCKRSHKDYNTIYNTFNEVLLEFNLDFQINRITDAQVMELQHIMYEPHIVINNQVVYMSSSPTKEEVKIVLQRLRLIK